MLRGRAFDGNQKVFDSRTRMLRDRAISYFCRRDERALSLLRLSCAQLVTPVPFRSTLQLPRRGSPEVEECGRGTPHCGFGAGGVQNHDCE